MSATRSAGPVLLAEQPDLMVGRLKVRPSRGEVVSGAGTERIEPRLMQVLVALAQGGGATVSRAELTARCWPGVTVSPDAVNRAISLLRRLMEQSGAGVSIETLPRIGYRIVDNAAPAGHGGAGDGAAPATTAAFDAGAAPGDADPVVRDLYARATVALEQPSRETIEQAQAYLAQVVALRPDFARGWAALAEAQRLLMLYLPAPLQASARAESRRSAEAALALDPALGEAFATLANLVPRFDHWAEVEGLFQRGLAVQPHSPSLCHLHAQFLLSVGRTAEGADRLAALHAAYPLNAQIAVDLAGAWFDLGRAQGALDLIDRAHALWPGIMLVWSECVRMHVVSDDYDRAGALLDAPPSSVLPDDPNLARRRLHLIARRGKRPGDVAAARRNFLDFSRIGIAPATVAIYALSTLDQYDAALAVAEDIFQPSPVQARASGVNMMGNFTLAGQPEAVVLFRRDTAGLRALPEFGAILQRIGLEDYWAATGCAPDFRRV